MAHIHTEGGRERESLIINLGREAKITREGEQYCELVCVSGSLAAFECMQFLREMHGKKFTNKDFVDNDGRLSVTEFRLAWENNPGKLLFCHPASVHEAFIVLSVPI